MLQSHVGLASLVLMLNGQQTSQNPFSMFNFCEVVPISVVDVNSIVARTVFGFYLNSILVNQKRVNINNLKYLEVIGNLHCLQTEITVQSILDGDVVVDKLRHIFQVKKPNGACTSSFFLLQPIGRRHFWTWWYHFFNFKLFFFLLLYVLFFFLYFFPNNIDLQIHSSFFLILPRLTKEKSLTQLYQLMVLLLQLPRFLLQ